MTTQHCICSWKYSSELYEKICDIAPTGHVWSTKMIQIELPSNDMEQTTVRKYAIVKAINQHLQNKDSSLCIKKTFIAPHHFLVSLLQWRLDNNVKAFTKLLSFTDLGNICDADNAASRLREKITPFNILFKDIILATNMTTTTKYLYRLFWGHGLKSYSKSRVFTEAQFRRQKQEINANYPYKYK